MSHYIEGALVARMAEIVSKRRLPTDTALGLLEEMIRGTGIPNIEVSDEEDHPGHPFGDLILEAFAPGQDFTDMGEMDDGDNDYDERWDIVDEAWAKFMKHFGFW